MSVLPLTACGGPSILDTVGPAARRIERLWWVLFSIALVVLVVVLVLLVASLVRRRPPPSLEEGDRLGLRLITWAGFVGPAVVLSLVAALVMIDLRALPSEEAGTTVEVVGWRWWWEVRYPDSDVVTANEIHVPAGEPVRFLLTGGDVIHSFWVPQAGPKMDTIPGQVNELVLEFEDPGSYWGACLEFCGLQHAKMQLLVVAEPRDAFERWLAEQAAPAPEPETADSERGREVFLSSSCVGCHVIRGVVEVAPVGPDLTHLASRRTIGALTLETTEEAVRAFVDDPHAFKEGVYMPESELDEGALEDLVAYLMSLR